MRLLLLLLILTFYGQACTSDSTKATKPASDTTTPGPAGAPAAARKNIVFFGNSLTAAYNLPPEQGFPALIQQKIDSLGLPYTCINAGLSGETTAGGNSRIDWVLEQPVDIFVLELGANDMLRGIDLRSSKTNLQSILDKVKAKYPSCRIVIAGMLAPPNLGQAYTTAFRDLYTDLAKANQAILVPFLLEGVATIPELNLEDGIHPNVEGQKIVAENVWKALKTLVQAPR